MTDDRLEALGRDDKWYLSCGTGVIWAPPFPQWLHVPGFWDEAHVDYHPVAPLFAVALVDATGRAVPLARRAWRWRPDVVLAEWETPAGDVLEERRFALPDHRLASAWTCPAGLHRHGPLWLVAFSLQPGEDCDEVRAEGHDALRWRRRVTDRRGEDALITMRLSASTGDERPATPLRRAALRSEGSVAQPTWLHTPFAERWTPDGLPDDVRLEGISARGYVHLALAAPAAAAPVFTVALEAPWATSRHVEPRRHAPRPAAATRDWAGWLEGFPRFTCSDPYLERYYDYRLYGLRLNRLGGDAGHVRFPCVAEGIGYFHVPITYSAQCHMWELRWAHDPAAAFGSLRNFVASQREDGGFHGRLYSTHLRGTDFYHANWGDAVEAALAVHDDGAFAREAYEGLSRYARWLCRTRDADGTGLFDVVDQYETGQEYMSRYLAVDPAADRYGWENRIRLKGLDVSVYAHQLFASLARLAGRFGDAGARAHWDATRARTADAIRTHCWDERAGLFTDAAPGTLAPTGVKAAVGFYPLLTDLVSGPRLARLLAHLADPSTFGTPWPLPSSSVDDPLFDARAEWKGKRHVCPWNGRAWPMTTSHVVEGVLRQWHAGRREAGPVAADLLSRYVRLFYDRGRLDRPTCYEHYNPLTGDAAFYRGIDDYMHSWVADLLVRGVAGLEPTAAGLRVDPLPLPLDRVSLENARVRGHHVSVRRDGDRVVAEIDGARHETRVGTPLEIAW